MSLNDDFIILVEVTYKLVILFYLDTFLKESLFFR